MRSSISIDPRFGRVYPRYPQSPKAFLFRNNESVTGKPELFSIFIVVGFPPERPCRGLIQSEFPPAETVAVAPRCASSVDISVAVSMVVTTAIGVRVETGNWVGASVGGMDVNVERTACVGLATENVGAVEAFVVGVACAPQALTISAIAKNKDRVLLCFICFSNWGNNRL